MSRTVRRQLTPQERRRKRTITILWVVGGVVLLIILAVVVVLMQVKGEPPVPPDAARGMEAGSQTSNAAAQVQEVRQAVAAGRQQRVNVQLTNADINELLIQAGAASADISNLQVMLGNGRAIVKGKVTEKGHTFNMQAAVTLRAENGALRATVGELWVGKFKAPEQLRKELQNDINSNLAKQTPQSLGVYVERIEIRPGIATVSGYTIGR
jgi:flagellar basal body-associated protein FliL